jgi:uncharacterized membrane protein YciS (DUF1049 family)
MGIFNFIGVSSAQAKVVAFVAVVVLSFAAGWNVHGWYYASKQVKATTTAKKIIKQASTQVEQNINKFEQQQVKERIVYRTIREKIDETTDDRVCFSPESLSLWNRAIAGANPDKPEPVTVPRGVDPVETETEVATDTDVLKNAATNFETCNRNRDRQIALIDEIKIYKDKMCVCTD